MVEQKPESKNNISPLVVTAVILGTIQGFIWFLLSLISILFYTEQIEPRDRYYYFGVHIGPTIYYYYLERFNYNDDPLMEDLDIRIIIGPKQFNHFMYLYLLLSGFLFVGSINLLFAALPGKSEISYKRRIWSWMINVTILSLVDLVLTCLIAHDYKQFQKEEYYAEDYQMYEVCLRAFRIVMTVAARGYVVWIVNVIFVFILWKHLYNLQKKETAGFYYQPIFGTNNTGKSKDYSTFGKQIA